MNKFLLLLVPITYLLLFNNAYAWQQSYYPRVNALAYQYNNLHRYNPYQGYKALRYYNPYGKNKRFPINNGFMPPMGFAPMSNMGMSPMGFGSPFSSPMSSMGMSPMGFGSPFSPMSGMGMSPMSAMNPMGFGSPFSPMSGMGMSPMSTFGTSMPFQGQGMPWGKRNKNRSWGFMPFPF